jgi:hypothetical protein
MRSCDRSTDPTAVQQPFSGSGHSRVEAHRHRDPYAELDDLMAVIESLCPDWPPRLPFRDSGRCRL